VNVDTVNIDIVAVEAMHNESSAEKQGHDVTEAEHKEHLNHVLHQLQNKPWAALYVACIFMLISLGVVFYSTSSPSRMVTSII
jgi:hypothetical protein